MLSSPYLNSKENLLSFLENSPTAYANLGGFLFLKKSFPNIERSTRTKEKFFLINNNVTLIKDSGAGRAGARASVGLLKVNRFSVERYTDINYLRSFHTSAVSLSSVNNGSQNIETNIVVDNVIASSIENERLANLQVVQWRKNSDSLKKDLSESGIDTNSTTISENFPWLIDSDGKFIDLNKNIDLFEAVNLISNYLEKKYEMDPNLISNTKLSELISLYAKDIGENKVTVMDLFKHVTNMYNNEGFKESIIEKMKTNSVRRASEKTLIDGINKTKTLGEFGEITLNEIIDNIKNIKWDMVFKSAEVTIHALPLAVNAVSYGFMMKTYHKYVYNRPYPSGLNPSQLLVQSRRREISLALFAFLGAPVAMIVLRKASILGKDVIT